MKKLFKATFFITLSLILLFVVLVVASAISFESNHSESVGIIGGADGPTAIFITSTLVFNNALFWFLCIVSVLFIASTIGWFSNRNK